MSLRPAPLLLLLTACSAPSPAREEPASPPPSGNVITASMQSAPAKDTMILEAKLAVCEKVVRETGEYHSLEVLGFKSLLPPEPPTSATSEELVGAWRSGFNPAAHEGGKKRIPVYEERVHYLSDGRVCGIQQTFDLPAASLEKTMTFISTPFFGTWKLNGKTLIEDYSNGTPPPALQNSKQTRRSRKILSLSDIGEKSRGMRFEGKWPNYFETVPRKKIATLREPREGLETINGELPAWCFESELKERAEK